MNVYERAVAVYGAESQVKKTIEECAELIVAFNHYADGKVSLGHVASELADVEIMLKQMRIVFGHNAVEAKKKYKKIRLSQMLFSCDQAC